MHLQVWIIDRQRARRRQRNSSIHCLDTLLEQFLIEINASPTLSIKRVGDVELRARISLRWIGLLPFFASSTKLFATEKVESGIEFLLIDFVSAGSNRSARRHFSERARFSRIDPNYERSICDRACKPDDLNNFGVHDIADYTDFID